MNKILRDPIAPKQKTMEGQKEWSYKAPPYDNRTSCSMSAGDDYGVGFRTPVGTQKASTMAAGPIPLDSDCFSPDRIFDGEDKKG